MKKPDIHTQNGSIVLVLALVIVLVLIATVGVAVWRHRDTANTQSSTTQTSTQPALATGSHAYSIESGGRTRTYRVYVPSGLVGKVPLVVMLHGGGGSGSVAEKFYGWDAKADQQKFIVAYPDGLGPQVPAWNTDGGCCGYPQREHINDVQFIADMVKKIEAQAAVDTSRIYATGISNGGIMAYTLACETDLFAAIGPDSATMLDACTNPAPTSVIHIHGLIDTTIKFDGSPGEGAGNIDGPPVPDVIARWQQVDSCSKPTSTTSGVVTTQIASCPAGRTVELITIANGGHGWPGAPLKSSSSTAGGNDPSQALDATSVIWQFFAAHTKASAS